MATRYQYFDSVSGDRIYSAADFARHLISLGNDGYVYDKDDELVVTESSPADMSVDINLGKCWIQGRMFQVYSSPETLTIQASDPDDPRIDRAVIRLDTDNRLIELTIKTGTAAPNPSAPLLTRTNNIYENSLAQIYVAAGATAIQNSNITDERNDNNTFGGVSHHKGGVEIDERINLRIDNLVINHATAAAARVYKGTEDLAQNESRTVAWSSELFDTDNMVDLATNNERVTINSSGIYTITAEARFQFASGSDSNDCSLSISKNGSVIAQVEAGGNYYNQGKKSVSVVDQFNGGDYITLSVNGGNNGSDASAIYMGVTRNIGIGTISG